MLLILFLLVESILIFLVINSFEAETTTIQPKTEKPKSIVIGLGSVQEKPKTDKSIRLPISA